MHLEYSVNHRSTTLIVVIRDFSLFGRTAATTSCANDGRAGREGQLRWRDNTRNDVDRNDRDVFLVWFFFFLRIHESWPCSASLISKIKSLFLIFFASISRNYFSFRSMVVKIDARITPWSSELILGLAAISILFIPPGSCYLAITKKLALVS